MRVLILGAAGMLGHELCKQFPDRYDTWATLRQPAHHYSQYDFLDKVTLIDKVDAFNFQTIINAIAESKPDIVINCIGIIKQLKESKNPITSLSINSLFPHQLHQLTTVCNARLIHISTDCIFSGYKGMYTETDVSDADDLYGRTKYLGEVSAKNAITLRTSIIGRELSTQSGLVEWFLSNEGGTVNGFRQAVYSGFTTQYMAEIMADVIDNHPQLSGVYHVSSEPINKYDLLLLIREVFNAHIEIIPDDNFVTDRSLDSSLFREKTGFQPPTWQEMIAKLA